MINRNLIEITQKIEREIYNAVRAYRYSYNSSRNWRKEEIQRKAEVYREARGRNFSYSNYCLVRTGSWPWGKNGRRARN